VKDLQDFNEILSENKELKERNKELLRSNTELTSFNHVASHDLQEPLRKIQLFISRIFDDKELSLSDRNKDYFNKMKDAANRMQALIDDLLAYSIVNGTDKIFEDVSLEMIVENVLSELSQTQVIEEKNAQVNYSNLPDVHGIPFQLTQLFTNLIGNALKYTVPGRIPVINIQASIVEGKDLPAADAEKTYHKIIVEDNGIGFEQEYAQKIFTLFQRLHDKQSFSGTGIGLAICKKVMENHSGFITTLSEPNQGTTFTIYIPVA